MNASEHNVNKGESKEERKDKEGIGNGGKGWKYCGMWAEDRKKQG